MKRVSIFCIVIFLVFSIDSCSHSSKPQTGQIIEAPPPEMNRVVASYYGDQDGLSGKRTASGEIFKPHELTAAHKTLPFGTRVEVTNPANRKKVVVRINDRGPFISGRDLDLSVKAAESLGMKQSGTTMVEMTVLKDSASSNTSLTQNTAAN